jgi:hypothetical protein
MKTENFSLEISKPCSESWNEMRTVYGGKFCSNCSKAVVDFTAMSNELIADFFKNNPGKKVCGNFYPEQLSNNYTITYKKPFLFNSAMLKFSLAGVLIFSGIKVSAQSKVKPVVVIKDNAGKPTANKSTDNGTSKVTSQLNIKVMDMSGNLIKSAKANIVGLEDVFDSKDGVFAIQLKDSLLNKPFKLQIFTPGFISEYAVIDMKKQGSKVLEIKMEERSMVKGEVEYKRNDDQKKCGTK